LAILSKKSAEPAHCTGRLAPPVSGKSVVRLKIGSEVVAEEG